MLLMFSNQIRIKLITVFVPNKYQAVRSVVRPHIGLNDERLRYNLWELLVPRQKISTATLSFVLWAAYQVSSQTSVFWFEIEGYLLATNRKVCSFARFT